VKDLFKPVKPKRLSDEAIEQILGLMTDGRLQPGSKLPPERELITLLGVSRTSLREAIRTLEVRGLLRVVPGRGTFVSEQQGPSLPDGWLSWLLGREYEVVQLLEMHEALEVKVGMLAALRATPADIEALETAMSRMRRAVDEQDHEALVAADAAFHEALRRAGGNQLIARMLDDLEDSVLDARRLVMALPGKPGRVVSEHDAVLAAVREGDEDRAGECLLALVRRSKEEIVGQISLRDSSLGEGRSAGDAGLGGPGAAARGLPRPEPLSGPSGVDVAVDPAAPDSLTPATGPPAGAPGELPAP
jgi:GntR family transcriptional regulator, transcriptional repressor for pyruvate dehydrogenase complex